MNILVCVKQVPDTTIIKIDPVKHTLIREGVPSILNTFDAYALETALRVRQSVGDARITALCMGPEQAKDVLKECISVGADAAYLVSDRAFGGSDTLATSRTLAAAIEVLEERQGAKFDLVFCGKQAIDGDTAQVGPELAEHLGYPQVTCGLEVLEADDAHLEILKEDQDANMVLSINLPCVCTFTKPSFDPRNPTIKRRMAANRAEIPTLTDADFDDLIDPTRIGLKGSPTHVKKSFVPQKKSGGMIIKEETVEESAAKLISILSDTHVI